MTNNQLCGLLGVGGVTITAMALGLMFFGVTPAVWGAVVGIVLANVALVNYD